MRRRAGKRRRSRFGAFVLAVLLVALAVIFTNVFPFHQIVAQRQQVDEARRQLKLLVAENDRLESQAELLHTPLEIERLARQEFGYVRKGEIAYVVEAPPDQEKEPASKQRRPNSPSESSETPKLPWERLWDYVTGADVVSSRS